MTLFTAQSLSNTSWAFSALAFTTSEPLLDAISSAAIARLGESEAQNLANTAWAWAALVVPHAPLMAALSAEALSKLGQAHFQTLHNLFWAFATLPVADAPLLASIAAKSLSNSFDACGARLPELFDFVFTLPGLAWSHVNLGLADDGFLGVLSGTLLRAGREVDRRFGACGGAVPAQHGPGQRQRRDYGAPRGHPLDVPTTRPSPWPAAEEPELAAGLPGMAVVLKPRGWEVDGKGSAPNDCGLLSRFVQSHYPRDRFPLVHTSEFDHGFIHRLDIPSSGLILTGTSFEGLYWIRWQLNVYHIDREYYVLCHGPARADFRRIATPIDVRTHKLDSHRSVTSEDHGGPALTWVCVVSHMRLRRPGAAPAEQQATPATPVCIRIRTGRKHQIRTHLRSSAHPSVADGMYTLFDVLVARLGAFEAGYLRAGCPGTPGGGAPGAWDACQHGGRPPR